MSRTEEQKLPNGWTWATIEDVTYVNPRAFDIEPQDNDLVSFIPMASVEAGTGRLDATATQPWKTVKKGYTRFQERDVLFAKITPCMENGKVAVAKDLVNSRGAGSTEFHVLRPTPGILPYYLLHYLLQNSLRKEAQGNMKGTAGQLRVPIDFLVTVQIPLPPFPEQHRIVAEIETQFTRLDAVVTAFKRVQANLKRYRASVLQAACEGRLVPTEAELARAEGRTYEPADQLLQRILQERRAKWESEQLATIKRESKVSKDNRWKSTYKEPVEPDTSDLSALPEGWVVASMDQLTTNITSGSRDWSKYYGRGHGTFLMAQNIRPGKLDLTFRQLVDPPQGDRDRTRSQVRCDDLLVTIVGANTGDVCRVSQELPEHFVCQSVALMRPVEHDFSPFLTLYMTSERNGQRQYRRYIYGAGRPHLNFDQLKMTAVLLPPPSEQSRIVSEVERRLSFIDELEATIDANLKRADRLRQALLKRAFEGKLLPQDPTDEPASVLLERIRAEREQGVEKPRATSQKTNFRKHPVQPKTTVPVQGELALRLRA